MAMARSPCCRLALGLLLLASPLEAKKDMMRHSMAFPMPWESFQEDWGHFGGCSLKESSGGDITGILVNPGIVDHPCMVWSNAKIMSDNFEASYVVNLHLPNMNNDGFNYEGLAFWYVHEDQREVRRLNNEMETKRRQARVKGQRFGLFGYRNVFKGLGAFLFFDAGSPMLTALSNDGKHNVRPHDVFGFHTGIGLYEALFQGHEEAEPLGGDADDHYQGQEEDDAYGGRHNPVKKKGGRELQIKLRVTPTGANVTVVGSGTTEFEFENGAKPPGPGGYLAVTALSYANRRDPGLKPIGIELSDLKVVNFQEEEKSHLHSEEL